MLPCRQLYYVYSPGESLASGATPSGGVLAKMRIKRRGMEKFKALRGKEWIGKFGEPAFRKRH